MLEIVEFEDLKTGDVLLVEGIADNSLTMLVVAELADPEIITEEGLDYHPDDHRQIVRIGRDKNIPEIFQ